MGDSITFKNGFTDAQAEIVAAASLLMTGHGADKRLEFLGKIRKAAKAKALRSEFTLDRNTASCFRNGILAGCLAQGRTDFQVDALLEAASILKIRSWIELPKVEDHKAEFDIPDDTPFDGDSE